MSECKYCSKILNEPKNKIARQFCSRSCAARYRTQILKIIPDRKNGNQKNCLFCCKSMYVRPSETNKKYCSCSCSAKANQNGKKRIKKINLTCPICEKIFFCCPSQYKINKTGIKFCSRECKIQGMKTGVVTYGFEKINRDYGSNPRKRKQINYERFYEHRKIMEKFLGRKLEKWEHVHHINENPKDNRLENLQVLSNVEHGRIHKKK